MNTMSDISALEHVDSYNEKDQSLSPDLIEISTPHDLLQQAELINYDDNRHINHSLFNNIDRPNIALYFDFNSPIIKGIKYTVPLFLELKNVTGEVEQVAVLELNKPTTVIGESKPQAFSQFGRFDQHHPLFIAYDLDTAFKLSNFGYPVALVIFRERLTAELKLQLKSDEINSIKSVVRQLIKAGYQQLYILSYPQTYPNLHAGIEQATDGLNVRFVELEYHANSYTPNDINELQDAIHSQVGGIALQQDNDVSQLTSRQLAKPFYLDGGAQLHILESGLYLIKEKQDENGETKQARTFICHSAIILGEARSLNNDNWKRVIQFKDKDHTHHTLLIPYEHFMGEAQEALKIIANHGLMPPRVPYKKNVFIQYIQDYPIEKRFRCVSQTGWHGQSFVTPSKTYGHADEEELLFHHEGKNPYATQGTLEGWQELSRLIEPHDLAVLSFSCAFAGQLVAPLGVESGGFHLYGSSTDGKSTITKASCGIWGNPKDISKSWRTTDNALENEAELRNDNFLNLDELRQAVPKAVSDIVYMLTGGQGKSRSTKAGKNRDLKHFNLMYMSTGEVTLEEHLRRGNIELDAGLLLRFTHLPSDAGKGIGVFDSVNYGTESKDVGNRINELASKHYGHAGIRWLEYLTTDKDAVIDQAQQLFDAFIQQQSEPLNGQSSRVLRRFALVATAGELATQAGITTWRKGRVFEALQHCFDTWLNTFGQGGNLEETKILEHIKVFLEGHGNSRFENINITRQPDGEVVRPRIHNQVGYYDPDNKTYLVSSAMFKREMCSGFNEATVKKILKQKGWLDCEDGRYTKRVSNHLPDGTRPTLMHFKADMIQNFNADN